MAFSQHAGYGSPVGRGERGSRIVSVSHWPSIADMLSQSYCGYEEDGSIGLSSWCHYIYIYKYKYIYIYVLCSLLCVYWALCVSWTNFRFNWYIYASTISFIIFGDLLFGVLPNLPFITSETIKTIITYKHGIYELYHVLPNHLTL